MSSKKTGKYKFSRKDFYNLVWNKPLKEISSEYLVSNTSLKKICSKNKIPMPGKGYWSKVRYNKAPLPKPLPPDSNCDEFIILYKGTEEDKRDLGLSSDFHLKKQEIENDSKLKLKVPSRLKGLDPIIKETNSHLNKIKNYKKGSQKEKVNPNVYVPNVSESLMPRTLRILSTLFKSLRQRGHTLNFNSKDSHFHINSTKLEFRDREKHKRVIDEVLTGYTFHKLIPTGKLAISVSRDLHSREWNESENKPFEEKISTLLAGIELFAQQQKEYQEYLEKTWAEQAERREEEKRIKEKQESELKKLQNLLDQSEQWHRINKFREFLDELARINDQKEDLKQIELIQWAREKADEMDPLIQKNDELFADVDQITSDIKK